jgi:ABC-type antimicrobial peptide transport system permease subunit
MLKNYLKIAWRNLRTKKGFTFINITGLAIGMAAAILIGLWALNEFSYDDFHANKTSLYKVWNRTTTPGQIYCWDVTSSPLGPTLKQDYPAIKNAARIYWSMDRLFNYGDNSLKAKGNDADPAFLTMFSFPMLKGSAGHALDQPNDIVLTEHLAKKIFGSEDPMNKTLRIDNKTIFRITGILKDLPNNTQFDFEYLVSLKANENKYTDGSWGNNSYYTFVQLQPHASVAEVNKQIGNTILKHDPKAETAVFLHPLDKERLYSNFENGKQAGGRIGIVRLLLLIGGLILLIACINFMNLSTAQSQKRAREVGVRKVMGARRWTLISQFLSESILIASIAGIFALLLVQLSLPAYNQLVEKNLAIDYGNPLFWLSLVSFIICSGLLAGSYPAFFLSNFKPVKVLKGALTFKGAGSFFNPRKILVVLQFAVAIVLIVSTIVVYRQIRHAQMRDTGYNLNNLIEVPIEGDIKKNYSPIRQELLDNGGATAMCATSLDVTIDGATSSGFTWDSATQDQRRLTFSRFGTSGDFIATLGLKLLDGRDIDFLTHPSDSAACLLNETAITKMGMRNPVGKYIHNGNTPLRIVGVFKDFIIGSPYSDVNPMIVLSTKYWTYNTVVRLNPAIGISRSLRLAEQVFRKYNPAYPFNFQFVDKAYGKKYNDQKQTGSLAALFAGLTIFISCLGLFGLAAYMAENRSKEIGIRKVLGASATGIAQMLTREFVALVILSIVIATPIAWWVMDKWLTNFTYRIEIGWLTFALAGGSAILIAALTVSAHAIKAAMANPVTSIRTE